MVKGLWSILRETTREFTSDRCPTLAAAIAYRVLFAVIPLVALLVAMVGWVVRVPEVERLVVERVLQALPLQQGVVVDAIRTVSGASGSLSIAGTLALVWAATGLFGMVRDALNVVWGVRQGRGFARQKLYDLGAVVGLGLLLGASILGTSALHSVRGASETLLGRHSQGLEVVWNGIGWAFPALVTFVAFLMLYRFVPRVSHGFADVWPGALVASALFELAKHGFTFYVAHFNRYEALYGALGTVMLFLLWIYVSALVLLLGAEIAAIHQRRRSRDREERLRARRARREEAAVPPAAEPRPQGTRA